MQPKQEALRSIREHVGNRRAGFDTGLAELAEELDGGLETLVDLLQVEFGVDLPEEEVLEAETVGDLCRQVARALAAPAPVAGDPDPWDHHADV